MSKRKLEDSNNPLLINHIQLNDLHHEYYNKLNCDSIKIFQGRIIFHSTISSVTIEKLFQFIKIIIESPSFDKNNNRLYLHIISRGGNLHALYDFINIKKKYFPNLEFVSIIENTCTDVGFILASLCNYRIIRKNVICYMSRIDDNSKYWGTFEQGENLLEKFEYIISNLKIKASKEKIFKYINQNNIWNAKKMIKIGFMDEII